MIKTITMEKEIFVGVVNQPGVLAKLTSFLVNNGINIEAILGYAASGGQQAGLMFMTNNNALAMNTFRKHGFENVTENGVLVVELENRPGALKNISEVLAQSDININYVYATACIGGCPVKIVLSTTNNEDALRLLK